MRVRAAGTRDALSADISDEKRRLNDKENRIKCLLPYAGVCVWRGGDGGESEGGRGEKGSRMSLH